MTGKYKPSTLPVLGSYKVILQERYNLYSVKNQVKLR